MTLTLDQKTAFEDGHAFFSLEEYSEWERSEKPFPNFHSCRIADPSQFDTFARKNGGLKSNGKSIDIIFGIKDGKSRIQALAYPKESWDVDAASAHCSSHGGSFHDASGGEKSLADMEWNFDTDASMKAFLAQSEPIVEDKIDDPKPVPIPEPVDMKDLSQTIDLVDKVSVTGAKQRILKKIEAHLDKMTGELDGQ